MALAPGTRLGPYEITAQIGEGGMGEVYRATDTKLKRQVALKVLPAAVAGDAERLARFQREAEVLAALNYPHIAAIYGLEEAVHGNGVGMNFTPDQPGTEKLKFIPTPFLVMELVEGPTLADRIAAGPLALDEALPIARQIAEALEAAHEQGIVHRDLKPANIKVRDDGTVKVLDFGLAKALDPAHGAGPTAHGGDLANSPTITSPAMTQLGVILGTAAYMSPEQARGKPVDKRADIWAFGCVLYEMLTGQRTFKGEDVAETLAAVIRAEVNWNVLPATVPAALRVLLRRCLEKDPRKRLGDVSGVRLLIEEHAALQSGADVGPDALGGDALRDHVARAVAEVRRHFIRRRLVPMAALVLLSVVSLAGVLLRDRSPAQAAGVVRFSFTIPSQEISFAGRQSLTMAPDGSAIAFVRQNRLWLRRLSDIDAHPIDGTEAASLGSLVFSPDSRWLAFSTDTTIRRISVDGGTSLAVCPGELAWGMTWDASGLVFAQSGQATGGRRGVFRCVPGGGTAEQLVTLADDEFAYGPQILPGGQTLLFSLLKGAPAAGSDWDRASVILQTLSSGQRRTIVDGGNDARFVAPGYLLYAVGASMLAAPFDAERGTLTGSALPLAEGVRRVLGRGNPASQFSTSENGAMVYMVARAALFESELLVGIDEGVGPIKRLTLPPGIYTHVRASRDGTRVAVGTSGAQASVGIYELAGTSSLRRLTFNGNNRFPIWSPDGQWVAFQSDRDGHLGLYRQQADGTGAPERLTTAGKGEAHVPESWSPDGRVLSFSVTRDSLNTLWTLDLGSKQAAPFGDVRSREPIGSAFSPDGRWLAYHAMLAADLSDSGVFVQPFPATGAKYQVPKVFRDFQPVWSSDGNELLFVPSAAQGQIAIVRFTPRPAVAFSPPRLIPARVTATRTSGAPRAFDVLPGGRLVGLVPTGLIGTAEENALTEVRVTMNWVDEFRARVGSNVP